jgi:cytochrome c-type biogenesis protein CcmH/NrfF
VRVLVAVLLGAALGLVAPAALAEGEWSHELSNELMSPYCPGRTLTDCPSGQAAELREWIQAQERTGRSREVVEEELYARFGDVLRSAPRPRGFGLTAYLIPIAAFLAGGAIVLVFLRRQIQTQPVVPERRPLSAVDPELEREIERELGQGRR